jgi:hypothetical protein
MDPQTQENPWAMLVYMVADHKAAGHRVLDPFADRELTAILEAARETDMPVVVQVDYRVKRGVTRITANATPNGIRWQPIEPDRHQVRRQVLRSDSALDLRVEHGAESDAAGPHVLAQFLKWGRSQVRAKRYAMLFWGHSCGPGGLFYDNRPGGSARPMGLDDIERAMRKARADVILFRDCCMSTLETAFQLRDVANYAIASQSLVPIRGQWPYVDLFAIMQTATDGNEGAVARALAARLGTYHDDPNNRFGLKDVPYALLDLEGVDALQKPLADLVVACDHARTEKRLLRVAETAIQRARPIRAGDPSLVDIRVFCETLADARGALGAAAANVVSALDRFLIKWNRSQKDHFRGVSAYCKPSERRAAHSFIDAWMVPSMYKNLELSQATRWDRVALEPLR